MDKSTMLECLINHYSNGVKAQFAKLIGITPQNLSKWLSANTFNAEVLYRFCPGVSAEWLLTGDGDMLANPSTQTVNTLSVVTSSPCHYGSIVNQVNSSPDKGSEETAVLRERVRSLECLLAEKERIITLYERLLPSN